MKNSVWPFNVDRVHSWAYLDDFLNDLECQKIINYSKKLDFSQGLVLDNNEKIERNSYRDCDVKWIYPEEETVWLYMKLVDAVNFMNDKYFGFHVSHFIENIQLINYKEGKGFYKKHKDATFNGMIRKLSVSIQLISLLISMVMVMYKQKTLLILTHHKLGLNLKSVSGMLLLAVKYLIRFQTPKWQLLQLILNFLIRPFGLILSFLVIILA